MKIYGHRGARGLLGREENTIPCFQKAIFAGADGIEFDVRRHRKSGELIVIHNEYLPEGMGSIHDRTLWDIRLFDIGGGAQIPFLYEVLNAFPQLVLFNIELKENDIAEEIAELVRGLRMADRVLLSAFDWDDHGRGANSSWRDIAKLRGKVPFALLATKQKIKRLGVNGFVKRALELGASAIHPHHSRINQELVSLAHEHNLLINTWTVNFPWEMKYLKKIDIDGIITDFPAFAVRYLK